MVLFATVFRFIGPEIRSTHSLGRKEEAVKSLRVRGKVELAAWRKALFWATALG